MNGEGELEFFRDILKHCHIRTTLLSLHDEADAMADPWGLAIAGASAPGMAVRDVVGMVENTTRYTFVHPMGLRYVFFRLPLLREKNLLFIGPYLSAPVSAGELLELGERYRLSPATQKALGEYYASVPVLSEGDRTFAVIDAFCERTWQTDAFAISEIHGGSVVVPRGELSPPDGFDDVLAGMEQMEMRYGFENELIRAVTLGQQHKETLLAAAFKEEMFERRLQDPLRNAKNYCIIMNTLLRKAAEQGGVHPLYIDRTSSQFAAKIEATVELKSVPVLMREMFVEYCRLVRRNATDAYSPVVKRAVLLIDADSSAELSLSTLAKKLDVSTGYLATVFKKETGKTVSEYVRDRRIRHAIYLLSTTNLQIQTVAMHCGIMDVQYFSKLFKRQTGKTPKEYRDGLRTQ